jgi:hypothetical protein
MPKELQARLDYIQGHFKKEGFMVTVTWDEDSKQYTVINDEDSAEFTAVLIGDEAEDEELIFTDEDGEAILEMPIPSDWRDTESEEEEFDDL